MKKKTRIIIPIIMILAGIIMLIYLLTNNNSNNEETLIGEWTTDGVTIYEFYKDNTGKLKTSLSEYDFKYKIEENKLSIDFKNEKSEDSEYTYKLTKDKLVLEGKNGKFNFKRK